MLFRLAPVLLVGCVHVPVQNAYYPDPSLEPITARQAARQARHALLEQGDGKLVMCAVQAIVAPVGGYLVDFRGTWTHDGTDYHIVRIGIPDGTEPDRTAPFALLALGDAWYPDSPDAPYFVGDLEYLGDRAAFENGVCGG